MMKFLKSWIEDVKEESEAFKFVLLVAIISIAVAYLYSVAVSEVAEMGMLSRERVKVNTGDTQRRGLLDRGAAARRRLEQARQREPSNVGVLETLDVGEPEPE